MHVTNPGKSEEADNDTLRSVLLPTTLPYVFAGQRVSLGLAFVSVVAAEMVAGDSGIGYYITSMQYAGRGPDMFAALFLVGLSAYLINQAFLPLKTQFYSGTDRILRHNYRALQIADRTACTRYSVGEKATNTTSELTAQLGR